MRVTMVVLIAALQLVTTAVGAESTDEAALQRIDRGVDAYRAGDYEAARREFEAARRLVPGKANPYRWLGMTEVQLGDCTRALIDFEMFLKMVPANDARVPEVIRLRNECHRNGAAAATRMEPTNAAPPARGEAASPPRSEAAVLPAGALVARPAGEPAPRTPLMRRWWFWTALGGAAAVVATGVTLGVVLGTPHETRLPPITCGASGCAGAL
jgi:hypothetical protein